jgi:acetyl coenzyme A synthetase (ADP forming)-like protein
MRDVVAVIAASSCDALLADGTVAKVRPIAESDAERLVRFHARLSGETTYMRFFSAHPRLSPKEVQHFTVVDHVEREALVAVVGDDIVGVGRYDRVSAEEAEVAFVVDDAWQHRGVGTLLMEHLATVGRTRGIRRFLADTLTVNARMLGVFRQSGLTASRQLDGSVIHLDMSLDATETEANAIEAREHTSERQSIVRLLEPRSIAVIGASAREHSVGGAIFSNLVEGGFSGEIYAVNARGEAVAGRRVYRSVTDIDATVDLAVIAVPAAAVLTVAQECASKGVHGLVVVSAGFAEADDDGAERQRALVGIARSNGMRLIGPNCIGVANTALSMNATFAGPLPRPGRVGLLSQSGAVGVALLDTADRTGLGISTFVSAGNKADVSGNDLLQYWEDDPQTDVVMLYLESLGNPRKFSRLAQRVSRKKPIVVLKSGRTAAGQRAASSHTAAMATSDTTTDALFRQAGVTRVESVRELFGTARLLASQPLPEGRRVAIVGNSGGPGILAADACAFAGLELAELAPPTRLALEAALPAAASAANPVDLLAGAGAAEYAAAIGYLLDDPGVDALVVIFTPTLIANPADVEQAIVDATTDRQKPVVAAFVTEPDGTLRSAGGGVVPRFEAAEDAVRALAHACDRSEWLREPIGEIPALPDVDRERAEQVADDVLRSAPDGRWLDWHEAELLLGAYRVPLVASRTARFADEAGDAAEQLGFPVVMKVQSPHVVHKTDSGGVALDLTNRDAVIDAWETMRARIEGLESVTIQPMVAGGVETIVGAVNDAQFGPLVLFGLGGTATELLGDRIVSLLPLTKLRAARLVRSLRTSPLLFGYRGAPSVNADALEDVLIRLGRLVDDLPAIAEIDLNPVIASPAGVIVLDAKVRLQRPAGVGYAARHLAPARPELSSTT